MAIARYDSAKHPRDKKGRFRTKTVAGIRVSRRSASVSVGKNIRVAKNKNLYVGVLARIENTSGKKSYMERLSDSALKKASSKLPEGRTKRIAEGIAKERKIRIDDNTIIEIPISRPRPQQVRARRTTTGGPQPTSQRKPRKPRSPRAQRSRGKSSDALKMGRARKVG